jgi:hypothetical protein
MNKAKSIEIGESGKNIEAMADFLIQKCGFKPEEVYKIAENKQCGTKINRRQRKIPMR